MSEEVQLLEHRVARTGMAYDNALDRVLLLEAAAHAAGYAAEVDLVWLCCAIHGARNQGITGRIGKALVVKAARAPTTHACNYFLEELTNEVGEIKASNFAAHREE